MVFQGVFWTLGAGRIAFSCEIDFVERFLLWLMFHSLTLWSQNNLHFGIDFLLLSVNYCKFLHGYIDTLLCATRI